LGLLLAAVGGMAENGMRRLLALGAFMTFAPTAGALAQQSFALVMRREPPI
jgi:hypothetical protein